MGYAADEGALERVEAANLWIMTRIVSEEEVASNRQQRNNKPKRFLQGYVPPMLRQMMTIPTAEEFWRKSGLFGMFALIGLCAPTQAQNFVSLGAVSALGYIYQRGRP